MYIAVKMNCFNTRQTEVRSFKYYQEVQDLSAEWLVFDAERTDGLNGSHLLMAYDDDSRTHLSRPY